MGTNLKEQTGSMLQLPLRNPEWRLKTGERNFGTNRSTVLSFVLLEERN